MDEGKPVAGFRCPECGETRYLYRGQVTHVYCDDDDPGGPGTVLLTGMYRG
jgi:hypothetical protein